MIEGWYIPSDSKDNKPKAFKTNIAPVNEDLITKLRKQRLSFTAKSTEENKFWSVVSSIIPWIFALGIIWFIMMRQLQATGNKAFTFGKSKAKMNVDPKIKITFNDVAGCDEAKVELQEIIEFLKDPKKFHAIGARIPKGTTCRSSGNR